jgi:membrane fusion protein (multidrug efflux system)
VLLKIDDASFRAEADKSDAEYRRAIAVLEEAEQRRKLSAIDGETLIKRTKAMVEVGSSKLSTVAFEREESFANLDAAQTKLDAEQRNLERAEQLFNKNYVSKKYYDDADQQLKIAAATVAALKSKKEQAATRLVAEGSSLKDYHAGYENARLTFKTKLASADAEIKEMRQQVEVARAQKSIADIMLGRTEIKALRNGHVTNRRLGVGQYVQSGQIIASLTSCVEKTWIEANFKETQIAKMRPGQKAKILIDAYPGEEFIGHLDGISGGSGSMFSVLPPENATGNFTKVVQRFPINIVIDDARGRDLRVGMSAVVKVYTDSDGKSLK